MAIAVVVSRMLAKSITRPIEEIQSTAIQLADGQYKKHIVMKRDDELGQLAQSINTLAAEIVRKEQVKNDFISSIVCRKWWKSSWTFPDTFPGESL